ncbi:hypothetical protein GOODEAATRI_029684 [Goodea atripinnis]|uniref:Secreted protein n=1 Tax=Goodea atripinnis TaxID=208336 RepID=A0ABV0MWG8_9TELE
MRMEEASCNRWRICSATLLGIRFCLCIDASTQSAPCHGGPLPSPAFPSSSLLIPSSCSDSPCFTAAGEGHEKGEEE